MEDGPKDDEEAIRRRRVRFAKHCGNCGDSGHNSARCGRPQSTHRGRKTCRHCGEYCGHPASGFQLRRRLMAQLLRYHLDHHHQEENILVDGLTTLSIS